MAWNGSGTFARVHNWVTDKNAAVNITASRMDAEDDGFATGITACLAKNGENAATANLPMGTYRHTGVGAAAARTDYARADDVQDGKVTYAADTGSANAYVMTLAPAVVAYAAGQRFSFKATNANSGASTLNVNSVGAKTILKHHDVALASGDIEVGQIVEVEYDGTSFQMLSQLGNAPPAGTMSNLVEDATPQLGGFLDVDGNYIQTEKGGDIASANPLVVDTDGDYFDVTGTTNFASMTVAADRQFTLQFDGALTLTHHATNLDLPGEANITTAAGDVAVFQSTGSNTVQCISYTRAGGIIPADLASGTDGELITWDANGDPAVVAVGTATHVLTSNGAGAAPTFQAAGGGAWNIIGTEEAPGGAGTASITITGLDSTYDTYAIGISDLVPVSDQVECWLRVGDSGGVDSGAGDYGYVTHLIGDDAGENIRASQSDSHILLHEDHGTKAVGAVATEGFGGMFYLHRPGDGTMLPIISGHATVVVDTPEFGTGYAGGTRESAITLDRINVLFSSGNIETGRVTVWGISHA